MEESFFSSYWWWASFLGFSSASLIQQDEFELTKAYTHLTWEDAEHTRTNDKGNYLLHKSWWCDGVYEL